MRGKEKARSHISPRSRGGVVQEKLSVDQHHPVRSFKGASRYFLRVAATPPRLRMGDLSRLQFIPTFIDRACSCASALGNRRG